MYKVRLQNDLLVESAKLLRATGQGRREAVVLWAGTVSNDVATISRIIVPFQEAGPLHFNVPLHERLRISMELSSRLEILVAQLHTHPRKAFHSAVDDSLALPKHVGALSIVIPDFGMKWKGDLPSTAVFVYVGNGRWKQLTPPKVEEMFVITS